MAQLDCPCGFIHYLDPQPDSAILTFPDADYEKFERELLRIRNEHRPEEMQFEFGRIYVCPECGRLMWAQPGDSKYSVFAPEPRTSE